MGWHKDQGTEWHDSCSMERQNSNILNMHCPPAEGTFCDEYGNSLKPATVQWQQQTYRIRGQSDNMTNSYSICRHIWKWTKKLTFHLLNLTVLKFYSPHVLWFKTFSSKFQTCLDQGSNTSGGKVTWLQTTPRVWLSIPQLNQQDVTYNTMNTGPQK
jgi:hypothetical protein